MKIYFAGEPGGHIQTSQDIRFNIIKNRLLSYYFIVIKRESKKEFGIIKKYNEKLQFRTPSRT